MAATLLTQKSVFGSRIPDDFRDKRCSVALSLGGTVWLVRLELRQVEEADEKALTRLFKEVFEVPAAHDFDAAGFARRLSSRVSVRYEVAIVYDSWGSSGLSVGKEP
jgi:hypothetical protein